MKSTQGWYNEENGTDAFGFNAKPGGFYDYFSSSFKDERYRGYWWCSTTNAGEGLKNRVVDYKIKEIIVYSNYCNDGCGVRCLKNK